MAFDRDWFESVFSELGLEITRSDKEVVDRYVTEEGARRMLVEVGMPERVGGHLTMHDFEDGLSTVTGSIQNPASRMQSEAGNHIILGAGDGIFLLDGATGEVLCWRDQELIRLSSGLENFVEILTHVQDKLNAFEKGPPVPDSAATADAVQQLMAVVGRIDGVVAGPARDQWSRTISTAFSSMGF